MSRYAPVCRVAGLPCVTVRYSVCAGSYAEYVRHLDDFIAELFLAAIDEHLDYNIGGYDLIFVARGMTPKLKSWQLSSVVAKLFAQAGLPDKAKRPDAKPPATVPPARKQKPESRV